jgi:hypothetical protein
MWLIGAGGIAAVLALATTWAARGRVRRDPGIAPAPDSGEAALRAG